VERKRLRISGDVQSLVNMNTSRLSVNDTILNM
jgi:hypothetical protein